MIQQAQYQSRPKETGSAGKKSGAGMGAAIGSAVGAVGGAVVGGMATGGAGALQGAAAGSALGGTLGGAAGGYLSPEKADTRQAMQRRANQTAQMSDTDQLKQSMSALRTQPPEVQQQLGPRLSQAYAASRRQ
jgi:uncharacterized protein YcfJ